MAVIAVGARDIGRATAERFVADGAWVVIADIDTDAARWAASALGDDAAFHRTDVADAGDIQQLVDFTVERFGALQVRVNNAGVSGSPRRFLDDDLRDLSRVEAIDLLSWSAVSGPPDAWSKTAVGDHPRLVTRRHGRRCRNAGLSSRQASGAECTASTLTTSSTTRASSTDVAPESIGSVAVVLPTSVAGNLPGGKARAPASHALPVKISSRT